MANFLFCSQFSQLSREFQAQLLEQNSPLFIQFYLGCYLAMTSSSEQISFLSSTSTFDQSRNSNSAESSFLLSNPIDFHLFNSMTKLFKIGANVNYYNQLIYNLQGLQMSPSSSIINVEEKFSVLAYIILFNFQCPTSSSNVEPIESIVLNRKLLFDNFIERDPTFGLCDFLSTLSSMSTFFDLNVVCQEETNCNDKTSSPITRFDW